MDNYRCYLFGFLSPLDRTWLERSPSFLGCIIWSQRWRLRWLHFLWWWFWWWCHLFFPHLPGLWTCLRRSRFIFHMRFRFFIFPFIPSGLVPLTLGWSTSPLGVALLRLFISSITIEIIAYLFSRELKVDLSRSDVDDHVGIVEKRSSKDHGCIVFFFSHV